MKPIETNIHESHSVENWKRLKLTAEFLIKIRFRIFTFAIVGFAMGFILTKQSREEYSATLTFSLESQNSPQGLAGIANQFGISLGSGSSGTFTGDNLLLLLTSRRLIEEVLMSKVSREKDTVLLANLYVKSDPDLYQNWVNKNLYPFHLNTAINLKQDSALTELWEEIIDKRLVIKRKNLESNIVFIKVSSHDPTFSKEFAVVLGNRATEFYLESKNKNSKDYITTLSTRVDSVLNELQIALNEAAVENDENIFAYNSKSKVNSVKKQLNVTMLTSLYAELVKNMEVTKALNSREEPIITFIDIPRQATKELRSPYVNGFIFSAITIIVGILLSALVNYISTLNKLLNAEIIEA